MAKPPTSPAERFLAHLYDIFGEEPEFYPMGEAGEVPPAVTAMVFHDAPEPGFVTGITYGLSLVPHPAWKNGRPELCITMESGEDVWARVAGLIAQDLRGDCPFTYGDTVRLGQPIHPDSGLSAFFVFAPSILKKEQYTNINVGLDYKINIAGLYPIHDNEVDLLRAMGLEAFWHHPGYDPFDIHRVPIQA